MATLEELYDAGDKAKELGDLTTAAAKFEECLALDEGYALAHSALAVVLGKLGRHVEAVQHARRVCELEPRDAFSFTALSVISQRAYAGTGDHSYIQVAEDAMARSRMVQSGL